MLTCRIRTVLHKVLVSHTEVERRKTERATGVREARCVVAGPLRGVPRAARESKELWTFGRRVVLGQLDADWVLSQALAMVRVTKCTKPDSPLEKLRELAPP